MHSITQPSFMQRVEASPGSEAWRLRQQQVRGNWVPQPLNPSQPLCRREEAQWEADL